MKLEDITPINLCLKSARTSPVKLLHKLVFEDTGDRKNRSRLRAFEGFPFEVNDANFQTKVTEIKDNFSSIELMAIANLLHLEFQTDSDLSLIILTALSDLESFKSTFTDCSDSDTVLENDLSQRASQLNLSPNGQNTPSLLNSLPSPSTNPQNFPRSILPVTYVSPEFSSNSHRTNISFSDLENILPKFNGNTHENVETWLNRFENVASAFGLSEQQKFLFVQRALGGLAKLHVRSEVNALTYADLKKSLLTEFGQSINSAHIHEMLRTRRCRHSESIFEYFFVMKELANRGSLDDASLMHYVISGINDSPQNKATLYGASTLTEFKNKLLIYDEIRTDVSKQTQRANHSGTPRNVDQRTPSQSSTNRYSRYGPPGRKSPTGSNNQKNIKCFNCDLYGHKANSCTSPRPPLQNKTDHSISIVDFHSPLLHKTIQINDVSFDAIVDTGSKGSVITKDVYIKIGSPQLIASTTTLTAFGNGIIQPIGSFKSDVHIDNSQFPTTIYVVNNRVTPHDVLIGMDILNQGAITINNNEISITKYNTPESASVYINTISVTPHFESAVAENEESENVVPPITRCAECSSSTPSAKSHSNVFTSMLNFSSIPKRYDLYILSILVFCLLFTVIFINQATTCTNFDTNVSQIQHAMHEFRVETTLLKKQMLSIIQHVNFFSLFDSHEAALRTERLHLRDMLIATENIQLQTHHFENFQTAHVREIHEVPTFAYDVTPLNLFAWVTTQPLPNLLPDEQ